MNEPEIWVRDLPKILKKVYKAAGAHFPSKPEQSLIDLVEWLLRIPSQEPRVVYKSNELQKKILTPFEIQNLLRIENVVSSGGNLRPYLGDITRSIRNRASKKNDFFSSDWGLLHLHLGADFENKKMRVSRSKRVLIARFEKNSVYFIDIVSHGRGFPNIWGDTSHLKILYNNWPNVLADGMLKGVMMDQEVTASEYIKLRNAGINTPVLISGETFLPPGFGIASDGSQNEAVHISLQINKELTKAETTFREEDSSSSAFFVVKTKHSVGFLVPKKNMYHHINKETEGSQSTDFFMRLLKEVPLPTDKSYGEFIAPKRIKI